MDEENEINLVGRYVSDRYRVLHKLGEGGMGDVYAAEDLASDRIVALKVLRRDVDDPTAPQRFLREAQTLSRVRNRNVVRFYDFDRDLLLGVLYVAMELAHGDDLSRLLHHGRLRPALVIRVVEQTANGLAAAHAEGIVHRDLKPANLKLKPKSDHSVRVKILDFGLVRDKQSEVMLTDLGTAPGTLTYMAPEVLQERELDARSDLYALGVIIYEMLSGLPPFSGHTPADVASKHLRQEAEPLGSLVPEELPEALLQLVADLMVKERDDRIPDARVVLERVAPMLADPAHHFAVGHVGESRDVFVDWDLLPHL